MMVRALLSVRFVVVWLALVLVVAASTQLTPEQRAAEEQRSAFEDAESRQRALEEEQEQRAFAESDAAAGSEDEPEGPPDTGVATPQALTDAVTPGDVVNVGGGEIWLPFSGDAQAVSMTAWLFDVDVRVVEGTKSMTVRLSCRQSECAGSVLLNDSVNDVPTDDGTGTVSHPERGAASWTWLAPNDLMMLAEGITPLDGGDVNAYVTVQEEEGGEFHIFSTE